MRNLARCGHRIRALREAKGLSLAQVAARCGLGEAELQAIEDGVVPPAVGPLLKIAKAIGVRLGSFLDQGCQADVCLTRREEILAEAVPPPSRPGSSSLTFFSLGHAKTDRVMEPFHIVLAPGDEAGAPSSHEGEEFLLVTAGQVEILLGGERHVLSAGDSIHYNSVVPHRVAACGETPATLAAVLFFPE